VAAAAHRAQRAEQDGDVVSIADAAAASATISPCRQHLVDLRARSTTREPRRVFFTRRRFGEVNFLTTSALARFRALQRLRPGGWRTCRSAPRASDAGTSS